MQEKRAFHERKACRMEINITEEPMAALEDYGHVPIAFEVNRVFDVVVRHDGLDGFVLSERRLEVPYQPVVKVRLHSNGDASRLAALLLPQIFPIFSVVAPCQPGASPFSVRRWSCATGC